MLMRNVFLELATQQLSMLPIFIELRDANRLNKVSLIELLFVSIKQSDKTFMLEQFQKLLESGQITVILDGHDELRTDYFDHYSKEIMSFGRQFPEVSLIISGRPNEEFKAWADFTVYDMAPLSDSQIEQIINKLQYDADLRASFIKELRDRLIRTHEESARNPLLLSVMFLTYRDVALISTKKHQFLEDAFITLWSKHDARKLGYTRQRYSLLDRHEFIRLVSALSMVLYTKERFSFSVTEFSDAIKLAMSSVKISDNEEHIKKDLFISTSLIIYDGRDFRFVHRYFQEYFSSIFVV